MAAQKVEFTEMADKDIEKLKDPITEEIRMVDTTSTGLSTLLSNNEDISNDGKQEPSEHLPKRSTVIANIAGFLPFLALASVAARYPSYAMLIGCGVVCSALFIGLVLITIFDVTRKGTRIYKRNLGNTTLTILLTMPLMILLYALVWYPRMRTKVLQTSQDTVDEVSFPAFALLQNSNWTSQATIRPKSMKCFLGWLNDEAPMCASVNPSQMVPGHSCNCKDGWTLDVQEGFDWQGTEYRYLEWRPSTVIVDKTPTYLVTLQVFFTYNASQSLADSNATQSPSLWLAAFDPSLELRDALETGYTRMILISANGDTAVNVGLVHRQAEGVPPAYDYALSLSSNQNLNIVCDTGGGYIRPCHVTLFIQIPSFDRTIITLEPLVVWADVVASAGAYFSFVQVLSWILSGLAASA